MTERFTVAQVLEQIFSNAQQDYSESEGEVEDDSEEENCKEYNPEHDAASSAEDKDLEEEKEFPQAHTDMLLSKNGEIMWSLASSQNPRLQLQQRRCRQSRQGDWNVQLQKDDSPLAPGDIPQHH